MPQIILIEKSTVIPATPARLYQITDGRKAAVALAGRSGGVRSARGRASGGPLRRPRKARRVSALDSRRGSGHPLDQFEEPVPMDLTGFKIDKVAQGTRVRVVDFAVPEDAAELQTVWAQRLKRLKRLYASRKPAPQKKSPPNASPPPKRKPRRASLPPENPKRSKITLQQTIKAESA